jgi:hypothetical protein
MEIEEEVNPYIYEPKCRLHPYGSRRNKKYWPSLLHHFMDYHPAYLDELETSQRNIKTGIGGSFIATLIYLIPLIILL